MNNAQREKIAAECFNASPGTVYVKFDVSGNGWGGLAVVRPQGDANRVDYVITEAKVS